MKRFRISIFKFAMMMVAVILIAGIGMPAKGNARDLTVVSWGGAYQEAQRKAYFDPFIKITGKKILDESYNGEMAKIKAMVEAGNVTWDVVQVEAPELINACEQGLLEIIDWNKVGGKESFIPTAIMGECGVGTIVWATVLAYDADKIKGEGPKSWADFWNVEKWPGKRALRKSAKFSLEIALLADGVPPADVYKVLSTEDGIQRAFKKLDQLKPHLQWWEAGAQPPQWLAAGDVVMTSAYNGRISAAIKEGRNFKIAWNGQCYAIDSWVIVKGSPNIDLAYEFIKFSSQPENQAISATAVPYGPTNVKAVAAVDPKIAPDLPTYPANLNGALAVDSEWWVDHQEELNERFNVWAAH
jgi:putative spermidine/putrescine transport system substrate-binding protein